MYNKDMVLLNLHHTASLILFYCEMIRLFLLLLQILVFPSLLAFILNGISHPELFLSPKAQREELHGWISFNISLTSEEYDWILSTETDPSISTCIFVDGAPCQCFEKQSILSLKLPVTALSRVCRERGTRQRGTHWVSLMVKTSQRKLSSTPYTIRSEESAVEMSLSLVLPLTLTDVSRASILLESLQKIPRGVVSAMFIIVPDREVIIIGRLLEDFRSLLPFSLTLVEESSLFVRPQQRWQRQHPYATQMAIKLLIARVIETDFYLTLDADHYLLHPLDLSTLLRQHPDTLVTQAVYHYEEYTVHERWWEGSRRLLKADDVSLASLGFGVTPALLSPWASLMTLTLLFDALSEEVRVVGGEEGVEEVLEGVWLDGLGEGNHIWTEYTLYRTALEVLSVSSLTSLPLIRCYLMTCDRCLTRSTSPRTIESSCTAIMSGSMNSCRGKWRQR